jgi:prepilin-type N-terminal cleavage/methylation domain-containing protein
MDSRRAFTLLEVLVALSIGAMIVLGARALADGLFVEAQRISTSSKQADASANAERYLRRIVGQVQLRKDIGATFRGVEWAAEFSSWCDSPRGSQERCRVSLIVEHADNAPRLVMQSSIGERLVLVRATRSIELRYLTDPAAGGSWVKQWGEGLSAPTAIGVIQDADTLIIRIGERG